MKTRFLVCLCILVFGVATVGLANEEGNRYDKTLMKPAVAANRALQKSLKTNLPAAAKDATTLQHAFAKIEVFWSKRGNQDGVTFAKNIQEAAEDVHKAAAAGNKAEAVAAAKMIAPNCGGCHKVHREKLSSGGFDLK